MSSTWHPQPDKGNYYSRLQTTLWNFQRGRCKHLILHRASCEQIKTIFWQQYHNLERFRWTHTFPENQTWRFNHDHSSFSFPNRLSGGKIVYSLNLQSNINSLRSWPRFLQAKRMAHHVQHTRIKTRNFTSITSNHKMLARVKNFFSAISRDKRTFRERLSILGSTI